MPRKKSGSLVDMCATTEPAGFSRKLGSTIVVLSPTKRCPDASKTSTTTVPSLSRTTDEAKRVKQLQQAVLLGKDVYKTPTMVICGDMNAEFQPGSALTRFDSLAPEPTAKQVSEQCSIALRLEGEEGQEGGEGVEAAGDQGTAGAGDGAAEAGGGSSDVDNAAGPSCKVQKTDGEAIPAMSSSMSTTSVAAALTASSAALSEQVRVVVPAAPSESQLQQWNALHAEAVSGLRESRASLARAPTGPTRACYFHGALAPPCVSFALDHFLYTAGSLRLTHLWDTLEADPDSAASGLPNAACPSDHLPIGAVFEAVPCATLDAGVSAALQDGFGALELEQVAALTALDQKMEAEALRLPDPDSGAAGKGGGGGKKGKGGGKTKPSPEMITHLQLRRRLEKDLKTELQAQREAFVARLDSMLHLEALDELVRSAGGKLLSKGTKGQAAATVWVEHGPAAPIN